jgi:sirohydrochlorin cobalto/nickelchelatase
MDINSELRNNKIGIVLAGHGSRLPYGKDVIKELASMYKENENHLVEIGFMNISKPSIPTAINKLAKAGVEKIVVMPVFLAHGVHTKHDIPHILGLDDHDHFTDHHSHNNEEQEKIDYDGKIVYTEPIGADKRIIDIIKDRINNALESC